MSKTLIFTVNAIPDSRNSLISKKLTSIIEHSIYAEILMPTAAEITALAKFLSKEHGINITDEGIKYLAKQAFQNYYQIYGFFNQLDARKIGDDKITAEHCKSIYCWYYSNFSK